MKDTELKAVRDRDLFEAYRAALEGNDFRDDAEAVRHARLSGAPRFYVSPRECVRGLCRIFRGKPISNNRLGFRRMLKVYELYLERAAADGHDGKSKIRVCEEIVETPAPQFYIEQGYAAAIIRREMARHNKMMAERRAAR